MDDQPPKKSRTVWKPPSAEETRRRERESVRLQSDQAMEDMNRGVNGTYRETQDWTGYAHGLQKRASAEMRALGHGADEDVIQRMLGYRPAEDEPVYVPSPEALAHIQAVDAQIAEAREPLTLEEREAQLAAREAELDRREADASREAALAEREKAANEREAALVRYEAETPSVPEDLDDLDTLRAFKPKISSTYVPTNAPPDIPVNWAGRRRMTAAERAVAEREGLELFGIDPTEGSAWSRLNNLDAPDLPRPRPGVTQHNYQGGSDDEAERIARLAAERQYSDDADGVAQAAADAFLDDEETARRRQAAYEQHLNQGQIEYDKRQADARAAVDKFMRGRGPMDF